MEILIDEIPEGGQEIKLTSPLEDLDKSDEDVFVKEAITLKANVKRVGSKVVIQGVIRTLVQLECSRCLEKFLYHIDEPFTATFLPASERPSDSDLELESDDLDVSFYKGKSIDLSELVREQIFLAIPMDPLCRTNCRGLCPECGKNLNDGRCYCSNAKGDHRGSKAKKFEDD